MTGILVRGHGEAPGIASGVPTINSPEASSNFSWQQCPALGETVRSPPGPVG